LNLGIVALAAGFLFISADTAYGQRQRGRAVREYNRDVRDARREYRRDVRSGGDRWGAAKEYRRDVRQAKREYFRNVTRGRSGWYYYQNGQRQYRPYSVWNYRNGYFYRRY
jgi:type II secretory pathway pseudopilin PulG